MGMTNVAESAILFVRTRAKATFSRSMMKMQTKKMTPSKYKVPNAESREDPTRVVVQEVYAFRSVRDTIINWYADKLENIITMVESPLDITLTQPGRLGASMVCMPARYLSIPILAVKSVIITATVSVHNTFFDLLYMAYTRRDKTTSESAIPQHIETNSSTFVTLHIFVVRDGAKQR